MLVNHDRERLINAMAFFARMTDLTTNTKLFRLLYLLDFSHYGQTGISVTGLEYFAERAGPVPVSLEAQLRPPVAADLAPIASFVKSRSAISKSTPSPDSLAFSDRHFTRRQLELLALLAAQHIDASSPSRTEIENSENRAFAKVWREGLGEHELISYEYSLSDTDPHVEEIKSAAEEMRLLALHNQRAH